MKGASHSQVVEAIQRHALELLGGWLHWAAEAEWVRADGRDGLAIAPQEVSALLRWLEPAPPATAETYPTPEEAWSTLKGTLEQAELEEDGLGRRWRDTIERAGLAPVEAQALCLIVAVAGDHSLCRAFRYAWADFGRASMPLGFAARVLAGTARHTSSLNAVVQKLIPESSPLYANYLVTRHKESSDTPLTELGLHPHEETIAVLLGGVTSLPEHRVPSELPELPARLEPVAAGVLTRVQQSGNEVPPDVWYVFGPYGSGRLPMASAIARGFNPGGGLWLLDIGEAIEAGTAEQEIHRAVRHAILLGATIAAHGLSRVPRTQVLRWFEAVERPIAQSSARLIWLLNEPPPPELEAAPSGMVPIAYPSRSERRQVWQYALGDRITSQDTSNLAGRFLITEGQIKRCVAEAHARTELESDAEQLVVHLETVARREAAVGLGRLATPETKRVSLRQLVVDEATQDLINEVISYTQHRTRLASEWGFERMLPYGLGVTALFSGPPGTGKTLAANAIATSLGLELFRVDLSQLVSKYIGETEKHLATLFTAAENGEVMLLFDEADSLFSKRTEVKSSVDRYANLEVNFLLQRIERFDGVVILTTNFEAGIDDAFARRIRFRVNFPEPDENARRLLWRALTPDDVPLDEDVDFDALAEDYELTGGHIKEVILRAASLALAGERCSSVTQDLLIRSAEAEYRKLGKLVITLEP